MATVRLSSEIQREVEYKMRQGFDLREKQAQEQAEKRINDAQFQVDIRREFLKMTGMSEDLLARSPNNWRYVTSSVEIDTINDEPPPPNLRTVSMSPPLPFPASNNPAYGVELKDESLQQYADVYSRVNEQLAAIKNERAASRRAVEQVFSKCTTLRQALELWPGLMDLLPELVILKHNEPAEKRTNPTALEIGVADLQVLNVAAVKNKLATAASA